MHVVWFSHLLKFVSPFPTSPPTLPKESANLFPKHCFFGTLESFPPKRSKYYLQPNSSYGEDIVVRRWNRGLVTNLTQNPLIKTPTRDD